MGGMDINGREFYEDAHEPRSPTLSWGLDSSRAIRSLHTRGESTEITRNQDVAALLGYQFVASETVSGTPRRWVTRTPPAAYPNEASGVPVGLASSGVWLYASSIPSSAAYSSGGFSIDANGGAKYSRGWKYRVEHVARPYNVKSDDDTLAEAGPLSADTPAGAVARPDEGDALRRGWASNSRYITKFIEPGAKALTLPNGFCKFVLVAPETTPQPVPIGLPVPFFRTTVCYCWHLVPIDAYPAQAIEACANGVNDAAFDGHTTETLYFSSVRVTPLQGPFGDRLLNVEYRFLHQPLVDFDGVTTTVKGWNHLLGVLSGKLRAREITAAQDGSAPADNTKRIFRRVDFSSLFRPDQV